MRAKVKHMYRNTPLNFKAMINRLDFTSADKRPIYLIEQELSTLRQGNMTLTEFYDDIEKKLMLLTNKTIMSCDCTLAMSLNQKCRLDALRIFITGTKKSLCDILFAKGPKDLPTALALAQEPNPERYQLAQNYSRSLGDGSQKAEKKPTEKDRNSYFPQQAKNPHFRKLQSVPKYGNQADTSVQTSVQLQDTDVSMRTIRTGQNQTRQPPLSNQTSLPIHQNFWPTQTQNGYVKAGKSI